MKRREFITLLGGAMLAWPLAARAQQAERMRKLGMLITSFAQSDREGQARIAAFLDTLRKLGWVDGRNLAISYRFVAGEAADRRRTAAKELVGPAPDAIMVIANSGVIELQRLTKTIPIVFVQVGDPVGSGFVASLAHPGGNITGFSSIQPSMGGKWLGVLKEAAPGVSRVAMLYGSDVPNNLGFLHAAEAGASGLGVTVAGIDVVGGDLDRAIADFAGKPDGGLILAPHAYVVANRGSIFSLAARYRLPAVYPDRFFAIEGGLMSYGPDQVDQWRGAATYVDRVLRGEKPAELPVQGPTKFDLVVNLKTARALGINIPPAFPLRADEVIE
jgi:putative ABC transport system substrate-binding protein